MKREMDLIKAILKYVECHGRYSGRFLADPDQRVPLTTGGLTDAGAPGSQIINGLLK